jgi:hypothetical protein
VIGPRASGAVYNFHDATDRPYRGAEGTPARMPAWQKRQAIHLARRQIAVTASALDGLPRWKIWCRNETDRSTNGCRFHIRQHRRHGGRRMRRPSRRSEHARGRARSSDRSRLFFAFAAVHPYGRQLLAMGRAIRVAGRRRLGGVARGTSEQHGAPNHGKHGASRRDLMPLAGGGQCRSPRLC